MLSFISYLEKLVLRCRLCVNSGIHSSGHPTGKCFSVLLGEKLVAVIHYFITILLVSPCFISGIRIKTVAPLFFCSYNHGILCVGTNEQPTQRLGAHLSETRTASKEVPREANRIRQIIRIKP